MKRKGQIWVETVIYTLIGLSLIGVAIALISPKINETQDRTVVEQSITSMNDFDREIRDVLDSGAANVRLLDTFSMRRGELFIDAANDAIIFEISNLKGPYSEPGVSIRSGPITIVTEEGQKFYPVKLTLNYSGRADITYRGTNDLKKFSAASTPYSFSIQNLGVGGGGVFIVNIEEISGS